MSNKQRSLTIFSTIFIVSALISACTQSLSEAPLVTPTSIDTSNLFISPIPSSENPMDMIAEFARQTSAAETTAAGGTVVTGTPDATQLAATGTIITPQTGDVTQTPTIDPNAGITGTPTNANAAVATTAVSAINPTPLVSNVTPVPSGFRPASYTLQSGEFPYCIARRFNVDPTQLLSLSGLTSPDLYYPGLVLKIPQSGAFPGERMLANHPASYVVASSNETIFEIACKYGDVDPAAIASANGISTSASLTVGQTLQIP